MDGHRMGELLTVLTTVRSFAGTLATETAYPPRSPPFVRGGAHPASLVLNALPHQITPALPPHIECPLNWQFGAVSARVQLGILDPSYSPVLPGKV